jgi:hypothetical protein
MRKKLAAYKDDIELAELAPFATGNIHECATDMTRIYDRTGYPLIEVWGSQALADHIAAVLNASCNA